MEGEGIRDKRWNRLARRREGNYSERRREDNGHSVNNNEKLGLIRKNIASNCYLYIKFCEI